MAGPEKREKYAYLDQLSTERLQELLRADLNSSSAEDNNEVIFHILEVMEQREKDNPNGNLVDIDRALKEFQTYYNIPEGEGCSLYSEYTETNLNPNKASTNHSVVELRPYRLRRMFRACITVAVTVALLFTILVGAQAAGIDVLGALARWTENMFSFGLIPSEQIVDESSAVGQEENIVISSSELPPEYQEFWTELKSRGINSFMLPTYIPNGFQAKESDLYLPEKIEVIDFTVWYINDNQDIAYNILYGEEPVTIYEQDDQNVEIYSFNGIDYYIFSNNGRTIAAWHTEELEYSFNTNCAPSELKTIINSMCICKE